MTPKALANKMKAKGLQKLRWWCEMCQKQCRDENGFKCHATSEGHLRNMQLYAQNPAKFREKFSHEFKSTFVRELSRRHHTNQVKATTFYAEYITDKEHVHMNSTKWRSLTEFILDLSREGTIKAEETEKGWLITWIDRATVSDADKKAERDKMELDDAERDRQRVMAQMKAARLRGGPATDHASATELKRERDEELAFKLNTDELRSGAALNTGAGSATALPEGNIFGGDDDDDDNNNGHSGNSALNNRPKKPMSAAEEIAMREMDRRKRSKVESAPAAPPPIGATAGGWLMKGIIVKVMNKKLSNGEYYKKKGIVYEVHEGGKLADVEMTDSGDCLRLSADQVETVLPQPGGRVFILSGRHKGAEAKLERLNIEKYSADVALVHGGERLTFPYEDICKLHRSD